MTCDHILPNMEQPRSQVQISALARPQPQPAALPVLLRSMPHIKGKRKGSPMAISCTPTDVSNCDPKSLV